MAEFIVDSSGFSAVAASVAGMEARVQQAMTGAMQRSVDLVIERQKAAAPRGRTSSLAEGIVAGQVTWQMGTIESTAPHALFIHRGRGEVRPVEATVLHWIAPDGTEVFAMVSGPVPPNTFFTDVFDAAKPAIVAEFGKALASLGGGA